MGRLGCVLALLSVMTGAGACGPPAAPPARPTGPQPPASGSAATATGGAAAPPATPLPFNFDDLPALTNTVTRVDAAVAMSDALGLPARGVPAQAYWGEMAADACGGYDMFSELMGAPLKYGKLYASRMLAKPLAYHQQSLLCGKAMAARVGAGQRYWINFGQPDRRRQLLLFAGTAGPLPAPAEHFKAAADPSGMVDTHCLVPWEQPQSEACAEDATSVSRLEGDGVWLKAGHTALMEFGRLYSHTPGGGNASNTGAGLAAMMGAFRGWQRVMVGPPEGYRGAFAGASGASVTVGAKAVVALREVMQRSAAVWGVGRRGVNEGPREVQLIVEAKEQAGAEALWQALARYHEALRGAIEARIADDATEGPDKGQAPAYLGYLEARRASARRALKGAQITRQGRRMVIAAKVTPTAAETQALVAYSRWRAAHAQQVAAMIDSLVEGKLPEEPALRRLGGQAFFALYEQHRALAGGGWPFPPTPFPGMGAFKVPGGGTWVTRTIRGQGSDIQLAFFEYIASRAQLKRAFKQLAEAEGWTVAPAGEHSVDVSKGGQEARFAFGQRATVSTLLMVHANF